VHRLRNAVLNLDCEESRNILAIDDKFEHDIDNLIEVGKEKGYLTYGDVNDMLPDEIGSALTISTT
jgi:predicted nucleotidyltransferase